MEEVIGSIPIRSTKQPHQNESLPDPGRFFFNAVPGEIEGSARPAGFNKKIT
jgi:hypothetical protein